MDQFKHSIYMHEITTTRSSKRLKAIALEIFLQHSAFFNKNWCVVHAEEALLLQSCLYHIYTIAPKTLSVPIRSYLYYLGAHIHDSPSTL